MIDWMRLKCLLCQVCDGRSDCSNARDEDDCDTGDTCPEYLFSCDNGQCISQVNVCNGREDCRDGSDEKCNEDDQERKSDNNRSPSSSGSSSYNTFELFILSVIFIANLG